MYYDYYKRLEFIDRLGMCKCEKCQKEKKKWENKFSTDQDQSLEKDDSIHSETMEGD